MFLVTTTRQGWRRDRRRGHLQGGFARPQAEDVRRAADAFPLLRVDAAKPGPLRQVSVCAALGWNASFCASGHTSHPAAPRRCSRALYPVDAVREVLLLLLLLLLLFSQISSF